MNQPLDPANPRHWAGLMAATLLAILVAGLIVHVLIPAIVAYQIGGAA